jgi:hypothetical protein
LSHRRSAPQPPQGSHRSPAPGQRSGSQASSQVSPKPGLSQNKITPQTGQARSHPTGRAPPPPRAAPIRPGTGGDEVRHKSPVPSHPPPPPGSSHSGPGVFRTSAVQSRHINAWGEEKRVGLVKPPSSPDQNSSRDQASPSNKPKRHAPPPPMGGALRKTPTNSPEARRRKKDPPPPAYAEVMKAWKSNGPPKPTRHHRTRSLEGLREAQVN